MLVRKDRVPAWQLARILAEAALCFVLAAATIGRPDDAAAIGCIAAILTLCGSAAIVFASVAGLLAIARKRRGRPVEAASTSATTRDGD